MALSPGTKLGPYDIVAPLGAGGMGEVYRARDTKLGRDVALKILSGGTAPPDALKRFQREARAVAALNHPNIVTIHSIEEANGLQFFTMEMVDGRPLNQLISTGGLPLEEFFDYAMAIGDALAAAHEKGIVHRDLKPANIMVDKRRATKILDFGLAKVTEAAGGALETVLETHSQADAVAGTLPYMSPEQLQGHTVDSRSDIFSAGTVFYEMATGKRPFSGATAAEIASAILRDAVKPVREQRGELPAGLEKIIARCLAKEPSQRYATAREMRDAMEQLRLESQRGSTGARAYGRQGPSIAVLPFLNMSADAENEFFADGITEEIINVLSQIHDLQVAARTSAFSFKGKHVDLRVIGEELNVRTVLEGSVRKAGNRLRITAQLVNVEDGYHLWSERYDREMQDVFEIQDEIARAITDKLKVTLGAEREEPLVKAGTGNMDAYQLYLKGRILFSRRGLGIPQSLECFRRAVELDAKYAQAWAGLADSYTMHAVFGFARPEASLKGAKEAAERAVALDPLLAEAHNALAGCSLLFDWDPARAEREFLKALELNPRYVLARDWYAFFYLGIFAGRFEEGITEARRAAESDPLSAYAVAMVAHAYFIAGRYPEALPIMRKALEMDPESFLARWSLQNALHWQGTFEESIAAGEIALAMSGRSPMAMTSLAATYADWGKPKEANAIYEEMRARAEREYVQPFLFAMTAAALGKQDDAIRYAREAFRIRDPWLIIGARFFPDAARLREDPRFQEILAEMGPA